MEFKFSEYLKKLEEKIFKGYKLKIFRGYTASNQTGARKIINDLYGNLDKDTQKAKDELDH